MDDSMKEFKNVISAEAIMNCMKDEIVTKTWKGIEIEIKPVIGLEDMMAFVDDVVKMCFTEKSAQYIPEAKDFAVSCAVIEYYSNIILPENARDRYDLAYRSNIVDEITEEINEYQFHEILKSIDKKIENIAQQNINVLNSKMTELYNALEKIGETASATFQNVDSDMIRNLIGAISDSRIDESKIVSAILESKAEREKNNG